MKRPRLQYQELSTSAIRTAVGVGKLLRAGFGRRKPTHEVTHHDIKLEMDVRAQEYIYRSIARDFPDHDFLGEEDSAYHGGRSSHSRQSDYRWVIDPLDGTVNYFYGIPHYCTSIACQKRKIRNEAWETIIGVIYDPSRDEIFSVQQGGPSLMNGKPIRVSPRRKLSDAIIAIGLFKNPTTIRYGNISFGYFSRRARKIRIMGAAALDLAYVASGRYDAYLEYSIKIWDIAAGLLLLKNAGGSARLIPTPAPNSFECVATNGRILRSYRLPNTTAYIPAATPAPTKSATMSMT